MNEERHEVCCKNLGRPRSETAHQAVLGAAMRLLEQGGYAHVTMEALAAEAGVSKATLYRWWPGRAAVILDAFLATASPCVPTLDTGDFRADLQCQMRGLAQALSGCAGALIAAILAEAQSDPETAEALQTRYFVPRRAAAQQRLERAQSQGQIASGLDIDSALDALYGPLYFRLLAGHTPLTTEFADSIVGFVLDGLTPK
jgi:AcrR family transcriptional regulator